MKGLRYGRVGQKALFTLRSKRSGIVGMRRPWSGVTTELVDVSLSTASEGALELSGPSTSGSWDGRAVGVRKTVSSTETLSGYGS